MFLKKTVMRRLLAAAAMVAACAGWGHTAEASQYISDTLGGAGPSNWAILGLGGVNVDLTKEILAGPGQTVGNVGVASSGNIAVNSSTPPGIVGSLYLGNTATTTGSACAIPPDSCNQVSGGIFTNQDSYLGTTGPAGTLNPALAPGIGTEALQAYQVFNSLAVDQTVSGDIKSSMTLSCASSDSVCVVNVTGDISLGSDDILTLLGTKADQSFILKVAGNIQLNGGDKFKGGQIRLGGTLDTDDAVIISNKVAGGDTIKSGGSSSDACNATSYANLGPALGALLCPTYPSGAGDNTLPNAFIQGILLAPQGGINFSPGMVIGEIIGGGTQIKLNSGSQVLGYVGGPAGVPAPASLLLVVAALAGMGAVRRGLRLG